MSNAGTYTYYVLGVFFIVLVSSCVLNLLKHHYIFQLTGIAFFFTYFAFKCYFALRQGMDISLTGLCAVSLPVLMGISACMISMVLGFWIFPPIRRKFKG